MHSKVSTDKDILIPLEKIVFLEMNNEQISGEIYKKSKLFNQIKYYYYCSRESNSIYDGLLE